MKIALIYPRLPPNFDAIGAYTAQLAQALAQPAVPPALAAAQAATQALAVLPVEVRILCAEGEVEPLPGVVVEPCFPAVQTPPLSGLADALLRAAPDWILLQYNPFSWGRWGRAPELFQTLRRVRRQAPRTRLALMVHEPFVEVESWKFAVMSSWQRPQLRRLGRLSDAVFVSIEPWAERLRRWFGGRVVHLPVGSNIARVPAERAAVRARLGLRPQQIALGLFGNDHPGRTFGAVGEAVRRLRGEGHDALILAVGTGSARARAALPDLPMIALGPQPADEVSRLFGAMDIALMTFIDGVSTRRSSFMTALAHGVATVTTLGKATGPLLREGLQRQCFLAAPAEDAEAFVQAVHRLAVDADLRARVARSGEHWAEQQFAWPRIAERVLETFLTDQSPQSSGRP